MARARTCPHCKRVLPEAGGLKTDDKGNQCCRFCGQILVPVQRTSDMSGWQGPACNMGGGGLPVLSRIAADDSYEPDD